MNRRSRFKLHSCQKKMFTVFIKSLNIWFWTECCQTKSQKLWVRLDFFFFLHLDEFRAENMKMITYCCVFFAFSCPHCPAAVTLSLNTPFCFDFSFKTPAVNKIHWDFFSSFSSIPDLSFPRPRSGQYLSFQRLFDESSGPWSSEAILYSDSVAISCRWKDELCFSAGPRWHVPYIRPAASKHSERENLHKNRAFSGSGTRFLKDLNGFVLWKVLKLEELG